MSNTLLNPNLDSSGYSNDNFLQHELDMGASLALVRNSPKLVAMNADSRVNITSIYRAAGDGNFSALPTQFVTSRYNTAPQAAYIHLTNEAGLPPELGAWTLQCATIAEGLHRKVVAFNAATNTDVRLWQAQEQTIRELVQRGHKIGIHLYFDGVHDAGGYAPLDYLKSIGADCFITEYGYIKTITHDGEGYRGVMDEGEYADWLDAHAAKLASYGWPAFLFSLDQWPNNPQGRAQGFGYEDRPNVIARCKLINQRYPMTSTILPPTTEGVNLTIAAFPTGIDYRNIRTQPNTEAADIGDLRVNDGVLAYPKSLMGGWCYVERFSDGAMGWVLWTGVQTKPYGTPTFTFHAPFAQYKIVSHFNDPRPGYITDYPGKLAKHEGCDFEPADGVTCDPMVHIGAACTVTQVGDQSPVGYGKFILVDFGNGFTAIYAHFKDVYVKAGQVLVNGQIVGLMGQTGSASEPHVHISLSNPSIGLDNYVYPKVVDPSLYLAPQ